MLTVPTVHHVPLHVPQVGHPWRHKQCTAPLSVRDDWVSGTVALTGGGWGLDWERLDLSRSDPVTLLSWQKTEKRINKPAVPGEWSYLRHTASSWHHGAPYLSIWNYSCALLFFICVVHFFNSFIFCPDLTTVVSSFFRILSPVEGDQPVDFKERDVPAQRMEVGGKRERQREKEREGKRVKEVGTGSQALQLTHIGQTMRASFLLFCLTKAKYMAQKHGWPLLA